MGPFAVAVLQALPSLIAAGRDVSTIIGEANSRIAAWLNGEIKGLQDRLHAPGT